MVNVRAFGAMIEMSVRSMAAMIYVLDIDPRIARHRLRAGRLHSGVSRTVVGAVRILFLHQTALTCGFLCEARTRRHAVSNVVLPVSYTHLPSPRDRQKSRMPSS